MNQPNVNPYLRTKVMTASPEQLRLMLYDGAIKFCRQAHDAVGRHDLEGMYNALIRAQKIVMELNTSLDHDVDPDLCTRLGALYMYMYRRLVDANLERDNTPITEVIDLLEYERETWLMVMKKVQEEQDVPNVPAAAAQRDPDEPIGRIGPDGAGTHESAENAAGSRGTLSIRG
jgi:flagellar protein FliS